jgi:hypothetical protein
VVARNLTEHYRQLLDRWLKSLALIPELEVVWLEGSLLDEDRFAPGSDIDIRFAIQDDAFERLWKDEKKKLLEGIGEYLPLYGGFRFLSFDGIVIEIMAFRSSQLDGLEVHEWEILHSRLAPPEPNFKKLPDRPANETWPNPDKITPELVEGIANLLMEMMATAPNAYHRGEIQSARFSLETARNELMKILFRRAGASFFKRYKHVSDVLSLELLSDLDYTYGDEEGQILPFAVQGLRTYEVAGRHLAALAKEAGGGFDAEWYNRLHRQVREQLAPSADRKP